MSRGRKASPTIIGAFVVGAAAIALAAIAIFGGGRFLRERASFVAFFPSSVDGLSKGAPVKFRGVSLGAVTDIRLAYKTPIDRADVRIPVFVEIDETRLAELGAKNVTFDRSSLEELIRQGLRAKLETQSLVTGVLYVGLDYYPGTPIVRVLPEDARQLEIPALPTTLEQAFATLNEVLRRAENIDLEGLVDAGRRAFEGVANVADSPEIGASLISLRETLATFRDVAGRLDRAVDPTAKQLGDAGARMSESLKALDATLAKMRTLLDPKAPLAVELTRTLVDLGAAARSVRQFAEYLDRNPNAIITGRPD